jgi:proline dehydrogenase
MKNYIRRLITSSQSLRKQQELKEAFFKNSLRSKTNFQLFKEVIYFEVGKRSRLIIFVNKLYSSGIFGPAAAILLKKTVFQHFCGGEKFTDCFPIINSLHASNVKIIIDHSSEDVTGDENYELNTVDKIQLISDSSKRFPQIISFIPIKCTSLMPSEILENITTNLTLTSNRIVDNSALDSLTKQDLSNFEKGLSRLRRICSSAQQSKIPLLIDAEQSHLQPAVEFLYRLLAKEFHQLPTHNLSGASFPVVYNTYQCYLKRSKEAILSDYQFCQENQLIFAAKVVRGAYMKTEKELSYQKNLSFPIFASKEETDENYNEISHYFLNELLRNKTKMQPEKSTNDVYLLFATHNRESIEKAIEFLDLHNVPADTPSIHFAQILGMTDNLTFGLSDLGFNVSKLVLYGDFCNLMPWMLRRLEENQVTPSVRFFCRLYFILTHCFISLT